MKAPAQTGFIVLTSKNYLTEGFGIFAFREVGPFLALDEHVAQWSSQDYHITLLVLCSRCEDDVLRLPLIKSGYESLEETTGEFLNFA